MHELKTGQRWGIRDGFWLLLAIVIHAALLLVPARQDMPAPARTAALDITLLPPAPFEDKFLKEIVTAAPKTPVPEKKIISPLNDEPSIMDGKVVSEPDGEKTPPKEITLSTARLLFLAAKQKWALPNLNKTRHLGEPMPPSVPKNWQARILTEDNRFSEMYAPAKTEIVDRWLASDGSHNVVIRTPGGHTLCGRGLAWNPMQPLVEHVMQFRPCGGGGKRTFEMPHRYRERTDGMTVANSATN